MSPDEVKAFLRSEVIVEEKVDGANIGISWNQDGSLKVQSRGEYLIRGREPQFAQLWPWLESKRAAFTKDLSVNSILFGEWCFAVHQVPYDRLPDWFLAFDVFDSVEQKFWSTDRRNSLARKLDVSIVPELKRGRVNQLSLRNLMGQSRLGSEPMEGVYVRKDQGAWLVSRGKLVRPGFLQQDVLHWSKRGMKRNHLASGVHNLR